MKNATEWMALDDDAWEYDAYGAWLHLLPGDDIELLVDDLNEALAGRHRLALEEISERSLTTCISMVPSMRCHWTRKTAMPMTS